MLNDQSRDFLLCLLWFFLYRLLYLVIVRYKIKRDGSNIHRQFSHEYGKGQSSSICNKLVAAPSGVAADDVEWCTYVISTVHAVVVVCVITAFLLKAGPWTTEEMVFGTSPTLRHLFDFSLAYFVSDGFLMTVWKLEGWAVMAAHHAVAGLPYAVYNFAPGCRCGLFVLALFLLVEVCTLPLNARWFLERGAAAAAAAGRRGEAALHAAAARRARYATALSWVPLRLALPLYLLAVLYATVLPAWWAGRVRAGGGGGGWRAAACAGPSAVAAHLIAFFCVMAFFTRILPEALAARRQAREEAAAAAGKPAALAKPGGRAREGYQAVAQEEAPLDWPSLI